MTVEQIIVLLNNLAPESSALDWDNVGLLVGDKDWEVNKVYIALDATEEIIDDAIAQGAQMIVTHHPMIFTSVNRVTEDHYVGRRILKLIEHHIAVYAMHTNFDIHGMTDLAQKALGIQQSVVLDVCETDEEGTEYGIGCVGVIPDMMTLEQFALYVRNAFHLTHVKVFGDPEAEIRMVAIAPGSGKSDINIAVRKAADVLVTGDVDHHSGIDAVAKGLNIVDAGHYGVEHIFIEYIANYLKGNTGTLEIVSAQKKEPFWLV